MLIEIENYIINFFRKNKKKIKKLSPPNLLENWTENEIARYMNKAQETIIKRVKKRGREKKKWKNIFQHS